MSKRKSSKKSVWTPLIILIIGIFYTLYYSDGAIDNGFVKNIVDSLLEVDEKDVNTSYGYTTSNLEVYFIDVGQADAILVRNKDENMLIDAGNNEDGPKLSTYLKSLDINKFKYVVGTHAHEDHIGGMDDIIRDFDIDKFYMPDAMTTTKTFESVLDELENKNYGVNIPKIGDTWNFGEAKIEVLYTGTNTDDLNNTSVVLKLTFGEVSMIFTGDATSEVEKLLLDKNIDADVLKIGHHGSQYSSSTAFLNAVSPEYAIISVGKNNTYGHPKDAALTRIKKVGATIYRTDKLGTIKLTSDGKTIEFENFKTDTNG